MIDTSVWSLLPFLLIPVMAFGSPDPPDPPPPPPPPKDESAEAREAEAEQKAKGMQRRGRSSTILAGRATTGASLGGERTPGGGGVTGQTESAPMAMDSRRQPLKVY